ncbi:hypothetical protein I7I48_09744 [Histoplasma ohiense]|nr:hypothetical protein I7I48_09744 [Histoplasma ohiense (nom. inval.)]
MWIPDESPPPYEDLYPRVKRRTIWKARIKNLLQRLRNFLDTVKGARREREWEEAILDSKMLAIMRSHEIF